MTMTPPAKSEAKLTRATSGGSLPSGTSRTLYAGGSPSTSPVPRAPSDVPSSLRSAPYLSAVYVSRRLKKKPLSPRGFEEEMEDKKEEGEERRESKRDEEKKDRKKRSSKCSADKKDAKKEKKDNGPLEEQEKDQRLVLLDSESIDGVEGKE